MGFAEIKGSYAGSTVIVGKGIISADGSDKER
jgi:hypothetical protein